MTLSSTVDDMDDFRPRPFKPWWRFLFVALGVVALGLLVVLLALAIPGCSGQEVTSKTWPEVLGKAIEAACSVAVVWLFVRRL